MDIPTLPAGARTPRIGDMVILTDNGGTPYPAVVVGLQDPAVLHLCALTVSGAVPYSMVAFNEDALATRTWRFREPEGTP